jgi:hypothetical protein
MPEKCCSGEPLEDGREREKRRSVEIGGRRSEADLDRKACKSNRKDWSNALGGAKSSNQDFWRESLPKDAYSLERLRALVLAEAP